MFRRGLKAAVCTTNLKFFIFPVFYKSPPRLVAQTTNVMVTRVTVFRLLSYVPAKWNSGAIELPEYRWFADNRLVE
jgi:hypothetical protein